MTALGNSISNNHPYHFENLAKADKTIEMTRDMTHFYRRSAFPIYPLLRSVTPLSRDTSTGLVTLSYFNCF